MSLRLDSSLAAPAQGSAPVQTAVGPSPIEQSTLLPL